MRGKILQGAASGAALGTAMMLAFGFGVYFGGDIYARHVPGAPVKASSGAVSEIVPEAGPGQPPEVRVEILPPPATGPVLAPETKSRAREIFEQAYERSVAGRDDIEDARHRFGYARQGDVSPNAGAGKTFGAVAGAARVINSGEIDVAGQAVRIGGILPIPPSAICEHDSGETFDCYNWAVDGMRSWIDGREATCALTIRGDDVVGACEIPSSDGASVVDVASWMIGAGLAVQDPTGTGIYDRAETAARAARAGIWSGFFSFSGVSSQ